MRRITDFLAKFKNLKTHSEAIEEEVEKIIIEKTKTPKNSFSVVFKKPNFITISSQNSALKSEVFLFKEDISSRLKDKFNQKTELKIFFK